MQAGVKFPHPDTATPEGLVALGGDLSADTLISAYSAGIFPWPQEGFPLLWFSPDPRGVLDFKHLHLPQSFVKWRRKNAHILVTHNQAFREVVEECRKQKRPGQKGTWILPDMPDAYAELARQGNALSVECWEDGCLIAGIYGVLTAKYFSAESMFYLKPNASKLAFVELIGELARRGHTWLDIQMVTDVSAQFGGNYISRAEFLARINI